MPDGHINLPHSPKAGVSDMKCPESTRATESVRGVHTAEWRGAKRSEDTMSFNA